MKTDIRIVYNRLLGAWFVVRGRHQTPLSGRFETKADALASLARGRATRDRALGSAARKPNICVDCSAAVNDCDSCYEIDCDCNLSGHTLRDRA